MFAIPTVGRVKDLHFALAVSLLIAAAAMAVGAGPARGAATFTVNKIGDAADLNLTNAKCDVSTKAGNQCTLRAAIQEANDTPGADTINFNIAGTATTKVITPATPLPPITQPVTINGYSQTGTSTNTRAVGNDAVLKIVLDGINAGADTVGLSLEGSGSVVRGLVVQRFDGTGIVVTGTGHSINGNFIGTTASGATARGNAIGVGVSGADHVIGGSTAAARNVISGNEREGVKLVSATNVTVIENYIGVMDSGAEALGNGEFGVRILQGGNNRIGQAGDGNVISGNGSDGVHISFTVGNLVQGNRIGTNAAGTAAIANGGAGVQLSSTDDNDVGGAAAGAGNVISGNAEQGVLIVAGANDNFLARNL
jgi:CSLREA domain-containing protein